MKYFATLLFSAVLFVACSGESGDPIAPASNGKTSSSVKSSNSNRAQCKVEIDENCIKDDRDGQTYRIVKIGDQVWMAENLNFETDSSFCYNNEESNCAKYGRLYRWAAAVGKSESECGYGKTCSLPSGNIQGVCPSGWHLPSTAEWETLFNAVGGQSTAGGFSALPAGERYDTGDYSYEGYCAKFWSSTEGNSLGASYMYLVYNLDDARLYYCSKYYGFSVRCLQDNP
ncbi:fibrobacter succinogenes major paralogous domain-containing protein [Fibrobacter sp. UWB10]|uniref:fibrobacter succinogenes major paralogous domain-containing protein n=1 Tax=Fibrobacter sp. UWB10 TaxID=1896201 RepID=UPI0024032F76|nr:fibrobacter succinogenes major paralogous domain-containing protein [Fibrobacter sp. UWB10]SMP46641.1 major paralogous domain-containing protein [Fibrobacter sp. UWB10]